MKLRLHDSPLIRVSQHCVLEVTRGENKKNTKSAIFQNTCAELDGF